MLIGIDLGTNNTVLSYYENGHLHVIDKAIPSIVYVEDNIIKIGEEALLLNHHKNLKRKLTNNPKVLYLYQAFLSKIKEIIDNYLNNKNINEYKVVVTVPAYFSETDKDITKRAVLGAGLPLLRLLAEPTAAGIAYGHFHHTLEEVILVFDMGAGTTDLTLMRKSLDDCTPIQMSEDSSNRLPGTPIQMSEDSSNRLNNFYEVISLMGDVKFGGMDITNLLSNILLPETDAEKAKINLSSGDIPELTQKKYFDLLEKNYSEKINYLFDSILKDGKINKKDVNQIILIGGSTKNPFIRKTVSNYFQKDLDHIIDPDTAVSFGATIYGNSLLAKDNTVVLVDRLPMSIGIEVDDGKFAVLIEKNTIVPTKKESYFTNQEDNQEYININIYQGEHKYIKDNCFMGLFKVILNELKPKATLKIGVTAEINPDGILTVKAKDSYISIKTTRDDNIEKYTTILPHELYEEEYEILNNLYASIKQQIIFQLEENIYLKLSDDDKQHQLNIFNEVNNKLEILLNTYIVTNNLKILEENIIEIKKLILDVQTKFSMYLNNYTIENQENYMDKLENIINNINNFNLPENQQNQILELIEEIIKLDSNDEIKREELLNTIREILGFNP
jgi:molecular chaperone DnaK